MQKMSFSTKNYEGSLCANICFIFLLSLSSFIFHFFPNNLCTCINPYAYEKKAIFFFFYSPFVFVWFHFSLSLSRLWTASTIPFIFVCSDARVYFFFHFYTTFFLSIRCEQTNSVCMWVERLLVHDYCKFTGARIHNEQVYTHHFIHIYFWMLALAAGWITVANMHCRLQTSRHCHFFKHIHTQTHYS